MTRSATAGNRIFLKATAHIKLSFASSSSRYISFLVWISPIGQFSLRLLFDGTSTLYTSDHSKFAWRMADTIVCNCYSSLLSFPSGSRNWHSSTALRPHFQPSQTSNCSFTQSQRANCIPRMAHLRPYGKAVWVPGFNSRTLCLEVYDALSS